MAFTHQPEKPIRHLPLSLHPTLVQPRSGHLSMKAGFPLLSWSSFIVSGDPF